MTFPPQVCEAVNTISDVAQGKATSGISTFEGTGELAAALDDFDEQIIINPLTYEEHKYRQVQNQNHNQINEEHKYRQVQT